MVGQPIPEILNTVLKAFQQEGGFAAIPKLAKPLLDAIIEFAKTNLRKQTSQLPGWAQKTKPGIPKGLEMSEEDEKKLDIPEPGVGHQQGPKI